VRQPDLSYDIQIEDPVLHSTPEQMTQELDDSLSQQMRRHSDQWFGIHRRWLYDDITGT